MAIFIKNSHKNRKKFPQKLKQIISGASLMTIKIILNGSEKIVRNGSAVSDLIDELNLDTKKIAVEKDLEIVGQGEFSTTILADGNKIEIVQFIGGG
jgi:thiamine biosynthesis protein ThiS